MLEKHKTQHKLRFYVRASVIGFVSLCCHYKAFVPSAQAASGRDRHSADRVIVEQIFQRVFFREWLGRPVTYPIAGGRCSEEVINKMMANKDRFLEIIKNQKPPQGYCSVINMQYKLKTNVFTIAVPNINTCSDFLKKIQSYENGSADQSIRVSQETYEEIKNRIKSNDTRQDYLLSFSGFQRDRGDSLGGLSFDRYTPFKTTLLREANNICLYSVALDQPIERQKDR